LDFLFRVIPKLIAGIMSILDASSLRDRMYQQQEEHELMWTALDDIKRMYPNSGAAKVADQTLNRVKMKYGR
jgi:hypothetical protein